MVEFVRVGQCTNCYQPEMLFNVTWEESSTTEELCRYCIRYNSSSPEIEKEVEALAGYHGGLTEQDICFDCLLPEVLDMASRPFAGRVDAELVDANYCYTKSSDWLEVVLPVKAHRHCLHSTCVSCNKNFVAIQIRNRGFDTNRSRQVINWGEELPHRAEQSMYPLITTRVVISEGAMCNECFDEYVSNNGGRDEFVACCQCDNWDNENNMYGHDGNMYCESCEENYWRWCDECDEGYHIDDRYEHDHDYEDDDNYSNSCIHNYSYKPNPVFFGTDKFHLGFELEVESQGGTSRYDGAEMTQQALGAHAYMKEDGSLEDGFEIVTHPHTLAIYQKEFDWSFTKSLRSKGFRSWNANGNNCGIHVHVSRSGFGEVGDRNPITGRITYALPLEKRILARQAHELRFIKLIYDNQRQVERIAGRSTHFASFNDKGKLVSKVKHNIQEDGHYSAVNTSNPDTLEVRVFKGSLKPERVLSALEFVHAATEYTRDLKVTGKNRALSWLKFCAFVASNEETYSNLATTIERVFGSDTITDNE